MRENTRVSQYRKLVLNKIPRTTKIGIKTFHDVMYLVNFFNTYGKIDIDYRDIGGDVTAFINNKPFSHRSINTAYDIGLEEMFNY